jgi:dolichol-phosphate mannosyltransferase
MANHDGAEMDDSQWDIPEFDTFELREKRSSYCVCIPVINEGQRLHAQLERMRKVAEELDVLILDGGSTDGSVVPDVLLQLGVRTLLVKTGEGRLSTQLRMGYAYALRQGYMGIITIDGNGKDGVDAIGSFAAALDDGIDLVQGSRFIKGGSAVRTPRMRLLAIRLIHAPLVSLAAHFWYTDTTNGFRAYSRRFLIDSRVAPFRNVFAGYELLPYLSIRAPRFGFKTREIPVTRTYPSAGPIPTKIHGLRGNLQLLRVLISAALGRYSK